jgi:hypothetical protein
MFNRTSQLTDGTLKRQGQQKEREVDDLQVQTTDDMEKVERKRLSFLHLLLGSSDGCKGDGLFSQVISATLRAGSCELIIDIDLSKRQGKRSQHS